MEGGREGEGGVGWVVPGQARPVYVRDVGVGSLGGRGPDSAAAPRPSAR